MILIVDIRVWDEFIDCEELNPVLMLKVEFSVQRYSLPSFELVDFAIPRIDPPSLLLP